MAPNDAGARQGPWLRAASLVAYSFSFLVFGLEVNLLGPTAIDLAERIGVVEADLGTVFMVNGLISVLGAVPAGWMIDSLPGHALLAASLLAQALAMVFVAAQRTLAGVILVFGASALTWNVVNTAGNVLCLAQSPEGHSGLMINLVNALFGVGALCAPLLAELCISLTGSTLSAYPATAALTALSGLSFLLLPSPRSAKQAAEDEAAAAAAAERHGALRQPLLEGGGGEGDKAEGGSGSGGGGGSSGDPWSPWGPLARVLWPAAAFVFLSVGLEVGFGGWTTVYATKWLGQSEAQGHALTSSYWAAFTAGRVLAAAAAAALRPATLLLASMPLALVGAAGALALPPSTLAGAPATAAVILVGLGVSTGFANLLALLEAYAPINGSVTGLLSGFAGAGTMLMPLAIALLAKSTPLGYSGLMWTTLASMLLQFVCLVPVMTGAGAPRRPPAAAEDVSIPGSDFGGSGAQAAADADTAGGVGGVGGAGDEEDGLCGVASLALPLPPAVGAGGRPS